MKASNPSPISVKALDGHRILLEFENLEKRIFDVTPYLDDAYFRSLKNPAVFNSVKTNGLTVEWCGGVDICPDEIYEDSVPL